jgi:predicted RNA binding protein YcfA (HicA-like mRNA interferase family)
VGRHEKTLLKILRGGSDANIAFTDLRGLLLHLGFEERVRGSHHIYSKPGIEELINVQRAGNQAKPYQVRQLRAVITKYGLGAPQ